MSTSLSAPATIAYSAISLDLTTKIPKNVKKNGGIYFTPPSCVRTNIELLRPHITAQTKILEPSCGSGEYITALHAEFPHSPITGVENNETIYQSVSRLSGDKVRIVNADYLTHEPAEKYDLIVGNPPYFVMKKDAVDQSYYPYFDGRPNIFILFIIQSIRLLADDGVISFVLPKNFLNCLYYDKTRKYVASQFQILYIVDCGNDRYIETQQDTIILIIQKKNGSTPVDIDNSAFVLRANANPYTIFTLPETNKRLKDLYSGSSSLSELGFGVSVGSMVWNQHKDSLTDDETKTRLIYSSDIESGTLIKKKYANTAKKNHINRAGIIRPIIVVNRGYGVGEYKFNYCLIDETAEFLIENHLICVELVRRTELTRNELVAEYKKILSSLKDERTKEFISIYFGNNAINTTEMGEILPIYI
jgi:tRNA1(Val) A37 N6-methylase TrmN6